MKPATPETGPPPSTQFRKAVFGDSYNQMNSVARKPTSELSRSCSFTRAIALTMATMLLSFFSFTSSVQAQLTISDDFDDGNDVGWTPYEGSPGTRVTQFPGGAYRLINKSPNDESGIFTRGASIRNDATFTGGTFLGVDVTKWDDSAMIGLAGTMVLSRVTTPGSLTTFGYLSAYLSGGPLAPQGLMAFIEFQSELQATY